MHNCLDLIWFKYDLNKFIFFLSENCKYKAAHKIVTVAKFLTDRSVKCGGYIHWHFLHIIINVLPLCMQLY